MTPLVGRDPIGGSVVLFTTSSSFIFLSFYRERCGRFVMDPLTLSRTSWSRDPYTLGAYSYRKAVFDPVLLQPIGPAVDNQRFARVNHFRSKHSHNFRHLFLSDRLPRFGWRIFQTTLTWLPMSFGAKSFPKSKWWVMTPLVGPDLMAES